MSRILRRPMFRGGRVDSRGTGITSGLSYAKGGRVGLLTGGSPNVPMVIPQPQATPNILQRALTKIKNFPGAKTIGRFSPYGLAALGGELIGDTANVFARGTSTPEGYSRLKEMGGANFNFDETNMDVGEVLKYINDGNKIGEKYGIFPRGGPEQRLKDLGLEGQYDPQTGKKIDQIIEDQIKNDTKKDNYNNQFGKKDDTEESTEISKADLEERQKLFADLLGSKKAKGEDISNMLLSFAGKALKPEADVKTAFGEFFEEESKRPSSKTKVDQAAAQLAINDYIAGKRSKEATDNLLARLKTQAELGEADLYENIVKIAGPGSNPTVSNLESALKVTKETRGKPVTRIKSTDTIEIEEKDHDSFFIYEDTKRIVYIDSNGNEVPIY
tara:strand:+ start:25 stop:1185 length:1161 start_codon:yes stop_codon:yes gene_type:complete